MVSCPIALVNQKKQGIKKQNEGLVMCLFENTANTVKEYKFQSPDYWKVISLDKTVTETLIWVLKNVAYQKYKILLLTTSFTLFIICSFCIWVIGVPITLFHSLILLYLEEHSVSVKVCSLQLLLHWSTQLMLSNQFFSSSVCKGVLPNPKPYKSREVLSVKLELNYLSLIYVWLCVWLLAANVE